MRRQRTRNYKGGPVATRCVPCSIGRPTHSRCSSAIVVVVSSAAPESFGGGGSTNTKPNSANVETFRLKTITKAALVYDVYYDGEGIPLIGKIVCWMTGLLTPKSPEIQCLF